MPTTIPAGTTALVPVDGFNALITFSTTWNVYFGASLVGDSTTPNGWDVVFVSGTDYDVTVPSGASTSTGNAYHFVSTPSHTGHSSDVGHFDVGAGGGGSAASFDFDVVAPASFDFDVDFPYSASFDFDVMSAASFDFDVNYPYAASFDFDVQATPPPTDDSTISAPYILEWVSGTTIRAELLDGVVLSYPIVITPQFRSQVGIAQPAAFTPSSVTLTNTTRSADMDVSAALIGWAQVSTTHTGFNINALPTPVPIYLTPDFAPGTPSTCGIDFEGGGRSGESFQDIFNATASGSYGKGVSGTISIYAYGIVTTSAHVGVYLWNVQIRFGDGFSVQVIPPFSTPNPTAEQTFNPDFLAFIGLPASFFPPIVGNRSFSTNITLEHKADEMVGVSGQLATDGQGEPPSQKTYSPHTPAGYKCSYLVEPTWCNGPYNVDGFTYDVAPSLTFALAERWTYYDAAGNVVDFGDPDTSPRPWTIRKSAASPTDAGYSGMDGMGIARISISVDTDTSKSDEDQTFNISLNGIGTAAGSWSPVPYHGTTTSGHVTLSVSDGSISLSGNRAGGINVEAAHGGTAQIEGRLYDGEILETGTTYVDFIGTKLVAENGVVSGSVPQKYSRMFGGTYSPALPATRYDFGLHGVLLYDKQTDGSYTLANDPTCFPLDSVSWNVASISHNATLSIETFGVPADWTVNAFGIKGGSAPLLITALTTSCLVTSTSPWLPEKDFRAYRYLELDLTASAAGGTFRFGVHSGKYFTVGALMSGRHTYRIDLCKPDSFAGVSRTRTGFDPLPDDFYGVQLVTDCRFDGFATGQVVTFHGMALVRQGTKVQGRALVEQMPGVQYPYTAEWFPPDVPISDDDDPDGDILGLGSGHKRYGRVVSLRVDGKQAIDLPHAVESFPFLNPATGLPWTVVKADDRISICQMRALANAIPGVTMSAAVALSQPTKLVGGVVTSVYSGNNPAAFLTFNPSALTLQSLDTDALMTPLICQPCFEKISTYPGQHLHVIVQFIKVRHGAIEGCVINPSGGSALHIKVSGTSTSIPTGETHDALTDADGYYRIKPVFHNQRVEVGTDSVATFAYTRNRAWRWIGLYGSPDTPGKGVSYDVSRSSRHIRAYPHEDGNIHIGLNPLPVPDNYSWSDVDTTFAGERCVIRWERGTNSQRVFLLIITSTPSAVLYVSLDEGTTWSMSLTVSSDATVGTFASTNQGLQYHYYRKSDGSLCGKVYDEQATVIFAEFVVIASDVDDAPIDCRDNITAAGVWRMGLYYQSGGAGIIVNATDGINFS